MLSLHESFNLITSLLKEKNPKSRFLARQLLFMNSPLSMLVEQYLYNNEGQPQKLDKFPMMRPIYDNMPKKLLLKCSRKTLKSTLISNIIVLNLIRYNFYRMMYVAPSENNTKWFSHHYLAQRLTSPPIRKIISKILPNDVYVKGIKDSDSHIILTYASDDPDRTRGPAVDQLCYDECLSSITLIAMKNNNKITQKKLLDVHMGDVVVCCNDYNNITTDRVKYFKCQGTRHIWRVILNSGEQIECTSGTKIFTNYGWLYLAQLLSKFDINRCEKAKRIESFNTSTKTANTRNFIRRWINGVQIKISKILCKSRFKAEGLCNSQSSDIKELYKYPTKTSSKPRLWKGKLPFFYGNYSSIRVCTQSMLQKNRREICQNSNSGMVRSVGLGRNSLLVYGRWLFRKIKFITTSHRRIPERTSNDDGKMVNIERDRNNNNQSQNLLYIKNETEGSLRVCRQNSTIRNTFYAIQNCFKETILCKLSRTYNSWRHKILQRSYLSADKRENRHRETTAIDRQISSSSQGRPSLYREEETSHSQQLSEKEGFTRVYTATEDIRTTETSSVEGGSRGYGKKTRAETNMECQEQIKEQEQTRCYSQEQGKSEREMGENQERSTITSGETYDRQSLFFPEETSIKSIEYIGEEEVYDIETEKYHNFFANGILIHNCQGMNLDIIPIVNETMAISKIKREMYAGTPLTTDNTLNSLWKTSNNLEWMIKCSGCNHWNGLTEDNEPMKMIRPTGLSCSKCGKLLNSMEGSWVDTNPGEHEIQGFHLAQPILPYYNDNLASWKDVYNKVYGERAGSTLQIYNEVFGLAYDIGSKPITEAKLKSLCVLGEMKNRHRNRMQFYHYVVGSCDWGVNAVDSRTVATFAGFRSDGIIEVFYAKVFKNTDYESQIHEIADLAKAFQPDILLCDQGPDPIRGKLLGNLYNPTKTQLVAYREGVFTQYTDTPKEALDWSQIRFCLNRSETIGFAFNLLNKNQILFPRWEDISEAMQDILAVFTEVKEMNLKSTIVYRHKDPDDFMHALNYICSACHIWANNPFFQTGFRNEPNEDY